MLKIDRENRSFTLLDTPTLADVSITERYDLQEYIFNSPDAFFKEIGQDLFLIGKEIEPSENVQDRIDLLAVDKKGASVIVELKRGSDKLQMLQAISYAGMVAQWESEDFFHLLDEDQQEWLTDFLEVDREDVNRRQRIILVAEAYDYALLVSAEWLSEQHSVDITCCRIAVAKDADTNSEYLACSNVFPAPELAQESVSRGRRSGESRKLRWPDWESALSDITNEAVVSHFNHELAANRESYLRKRTLMYRLAGKRRWHLEARNKNAYVWQEGRFEGDIDYWKHRLTKPEDVKSVKDGQCLRWSLYTSADFQFFHQAATENLESTEWFESGSEEELRVSDAKELSKQTI